MDRWLTRLDRRPWLWLLLGMALIAASQIRWPIAALAWIIAVPLLRYVRLTEGWRPRLLLVAGLTGAWTLATLKIVTDPLPPVLALGFGVPIGLFAAAPYLALGAVRDTLAPAGRVLLFAVLATGAEWVQRNGTPLLSWGALAQSQLDDLPLMQAASWFGLAGVSLLIHGVGAALESVLAGEGGAPRRLGAWLAVVVVAHGLGAARLAADSAGGQPTVLAATVDTPSDIRGDALPPKETLAAWKQALFERSRQAADAGAELVVWTEAATMVEPAEEAAWKRDLAALAAELQIELVAAYVVPISWAPLQYENKLVWAHPDGRIGQEYLKHNPVPGEPAVPGVAPHRSVDTGFGAAAAAICYDYDDPDLAHAHARLGVDLVALPSSDWRGIDPIHTEMAAVRAIEGGHSVLRSTRWGLSAGVDPLGRIVGRRSSFDDAEHGVMLVRLPKHGRQTVYGWLGESGVGVLLLLLGAFAVAVGRRYSAGDELDRPHHRIPCAAPGLRAEGRRPDAVA